MTSVLYYLAGSLLYVALPLTLALLLSRNPGEAAADMAWPSSPNRQLVAAVFWTPLVSPVIVVLIAGYKLHPLWSMSMWTLLPVMLLSPPAITIGPWNGRKILALAMAVPFVSLLASPAVAIIVHRMQRLEPSAFHAQLLAKQVEEGWLASSGQPLRFVDGIANLAKSCRLRQGSAACPGRHADIPDQGYSRRESRRLLCRHTMRARCFNRGFAGTGKPADQHHDQA
jgi:hypothetical protein